MSNNKIEISWASIFRVLAVVLGVLFIFKIAQVIALFFVVVVLVAAFSPIVDNWSRYIPRILAVILLYLLGLVILATTGFLIIPPLIDQLQALATNLPTYFEKILPLLQNWKNLINSSQQSLTSISQTISQVSAGIYSTTIGFIGGLIAFVTIFVLTFYMLLEKNAVRDLIVSFLPIEKREQIIIALRKIIAKMGGWLRGQLMLCLIVGILDLTGLLIFRVPYALTLAIFAGLTEIIPYIGPWLGFVPALLIALTVSPLLGLIVAIWYVAVQQIEGHILVPKIMQKTVGLNPVIVILAFLIGGSLFGILGLILAVPAAAAILVVIQEWSNLFKNAPPSSEVNS